MKVKFSRMLLACGGLINGFGEFPFWFFRWILLMLDLLGPAGPFHGLER
jgi:hypothetical protein